MNKTWSVVLIILACLGVLSGSYWYFVLRPATSTTEQIEAASVPVQKQSAAPSGQPPASTVNNQPVPQVPEVKPKQEATEPLEAGKQEPIVEVGIEQPVVGVSSPLPPPIDPLLLSGLLKLPVPSAPKVPVPFAVREPLVQASTEVATKEETPSADVQPIPVEPAVIIEETPEMVVPETKAPQEEPSAIEVAPESEKVVLTPSVPQTPVIPTTRVEIDPQPLTWTIGTAVSFANFGLPLPLTHNGFSVQVDILKHTDTLFSFGGALEYGQIDGDSYLSVLAKGQWTFREDRAFNIPVSVSLGPTFLMGTSNEFGLSAKVLGGFSYEIVRNLRFFYQAGIQAQWVITKPDFTLTLEPMRVGFSYSF